VLPAASVARTAKLCEPSDRPAYAFGDEQLAHAPASRRHWKLERDSEELKAKDADVEEEVPDGPEVIDVSGAVRSGVGGGGGGGGGGNAGRLCFESGSEPRYTSTPSQTPSPSVSGLRGEVCEVRTS
jgi:hypothetical protein